MIVQFVISEWCCGARVRNEMVNNMGFVEIKDLLMHLNFKEKSCWIH